jgi:hypothetical protein
MRALAATTFSLCCQVCSAQVVLVPLGIPAGATGIVGSAIDRVGGTVVGYALLSGARVVHLWHNGVPQSLGFVGTPNGLSETGEWVTGNAVMNPTSGAFVWHAPGPPEFLGTIPGAPFETSTGNGVSEGGSSVAGAYTFAGSPGALPFRWDSGAGIRLLELPPSDNIGVALSLSPGGFKPVGYSQQGPTGLRRALWWDTGRHARSLPTPAGILGDAVASNASVLGSVVVGYGWTGSSFVPLRWVTNSGAVIPTPSDAGTAVKVSNDGWRVAAGAYVWDPVFGVRSIESIASAVGQAFPQGWTEISAVDISPDGTTILGNANDALSQPRAWTLRMPPLCYANCDGSTGQPILNVLDFNCFLNHFAAGDAYADCYLDGGTDVADFTCFLNKFSAGCP